MCSGERWDIAYVPNPEDAFLMYHPLYRPTAMDRISKSEILNMK